MNYGTKKFYENHHKTKWYYKQNNQGLDLMDNWNTHLKIESPVLDVGCGNGLLCDYLVRKDITVTGLDIIDDIYEREGYEYVKHDITEPWPFEDKSFKTLLCFDVMEHLRKPDIPFVLGEMNRVGVNRIISVAHYDAIDAYTHLTIKPSEWWMTFLGSFNGEVWKKIHEIERRPDCRASLFLSMGK